MRHGPAGTSGQHERRVTMPRRLFGTVLLSLAVVLFLGGCASGAEPAAGKATSPACAGECDDCAGKCGAMEKGATAEGTALVCPVMGNPIPEGKGYVHEYKGKKITFCCEGCVPTFEKDPEKYLEKLEQ